MIRFGVIRDFAWDLPLIVLFSILGAPAEDVAQVKKATESRVLIAYGKPSAEEQVRAAEGLLAFWGYAQALVEDRIHNPRDDFTTDLVQARDGRDFEGERMGPWRRGQGGHGGARS